MAFLVIGAFFVTDKLRYAGMPVAERKEQLLWEKENFPKLDALYADGYYSLYKMSEYGAQMGEYAFAKEEILEYLGIE